MHYIKKVLILLSVMIGLPYMVSAQVQTNIQASFEKYSSTVLQEKVYAHTDRLFYMTGEIVWFKLYTVDAGTNKPINISKVAYVDILDNANNPVLQAKIGLKNGAGNGSLYIPVTLPNGNYKLRAYTNWMKNFSPEMYFEKQLTIVNPLVSPDAPVAKLNAGYDIQFFPEGGSLVNGLSSTIGFKATGQDGKGIDVAGVVIGPRNDTVARFQSSKFGMGRFNFTPLANNIYKAVMRVGTNNSIIKQLPDAAPQGYIMHVTDDGDKQVSITINGSPATPANDALYLLIHNGPIVSIAQLLHTDANHTNTALIDRAKLGPGVNHITLFNANRQPIAERLLFKRPSVLALQASAQPSYGLRKKVAVDIAAKNNNGQPQTANLSMAVYHLDSLNAGGGTNLVSYLWLTAELKGHIEMPEYYFTDVSPATNQSLDDLLLTQGWSRFKWNDVLSNTTPAFRFLPEFNGHLVSGQVNNRAGKPATYTIVYMGAISKKVQLYGANSGKDGQLLFNTRDLYGPNEIVLQTNTATDTSTYQMSLKSPFSEQYSATKLTPFYISKAINKQLEANSMGMQVQNLYKPEHLWQFNTTGIDSTSFYANQYKPYLLDNFTRFTTMEEVLREYVMEVNVVKSKNFHIKTIGKYGLFLKDDENPLVLLDGVPVFNTDKVFTIDPLKVKRLDVINQRYYWGPIAANGILAYSSYKTDMAGGFDLDPRAVVLDYEGLQIQRDFYSPVYATDDQLKSRIPDFRNLLYWSPDVNTGADGKAQATFYTSDKAGKYIGVIQGLTGSGLAGSQYFIFDVNK